eukprot:TRINITY_DN10499_c0_g1_i1.p1 TRINITY_DN10499_c0_g1~~TRINITY_DN10499_c0_g1_i1.p1  ORF type:complete len:236 (+),score=17.96 TRINITY_DN10499_c0_g1_i1:127-834(+)
MSQPAVSKETQKLLQKMMKDAGLTPFQQRQLNGSMHGESLKFMFFRLNCTSFRIAGKALPSKVNPTTSAKEKVPAPRPKPKKVFKGPPTTGRRRHQSDILQASDNYQRPKYEAPPGGIDRQAERDRLFDVMAFGSETAEAKAKIRAKVSGSQPQSRAQSARTKAPPRTSEPDLFDIVMTEIEERRAHMDDLRAKHQLDRSTESQINTEISQRIRQLEIMDRDRTKQLRALEARRS